MVIERFKLIQSLCVIVIVFLIYIKNLFFTDLTTSVWVKLVNTLPTTMIATILDINDLISLDESDNFKLVFFTGGLILIFFFDILFIL